MTQKLCVASVGEKINLPSVPVGKVLNRLQTMLSPRGAGSQTARSEQPPLPSARFRPATAAEAAQEAALSKQDGLGQLETSGERSATASAAVGRWTKVHTAIEKLVQHPG
jgi:hypothetical protein